MNSIYVILGSTGEYSDHREWIFSYVKTKKKAQKVVSFLNSKLKELNICSENDSHCRNVSYLGEQAINNIAQMKKIDKFFDLDYTGSRYVSVIVTECNIKT